MLAHIDEKLFKKLKKLLDSAERYQKNPLTRSFYKNADQNGSLKLAHGSTYPDQIIELNLKSVQDIFLIVPRLYEFHMKESSFLIIGLERFRRIVAVALFLLQKEYSFYLNCSEDDFFYQVFEQFPDMFEEKQVSAFTIQKFPNLSSEDLTIVLRLHALIVIYGHLKSKFNEAKNFAEKLEKELELEKKLFENLSKVVGEFESFVEGSKVLKSSENSEIIINQIDEAEKARQEIKEKRAIAAEQKRNQKFQALISCCTQSNFLEDPYARLAFQTQMINLTSDVIEHASSDQKELLEKLYFIFELLKLPQKWNVFSNLIFGSYQETNEGLACQEGLKPLFSSLKISAPFVRSTLFQDHTSALIELQERNDLIRKTLVSLEDNAQSFRSLDAFEEAKGKFHKESQGDVNYIEFSEGFDSSEEKLDYVLHPYSLYDECYNTVKKYGIFFVSDDFLSRIIKEKSELEATYKKILYFNCLTEISELDFWKEIDMEKPGSEKILELKANQKIQMIIWPKFEFRPDILRYFVSLAESLKSEGETVFIFPNRGHGFSIGLAIFLYLTKNEKELSDLINTKISKKDAVAEEALAYQITLQMFTFQNVSYLQKYLYKLQKEDKDVDKKCTSLGFQSASQTLEGCDYANIENRKHLYEVVLDLKCMSSKNPPPYVLTIRMLQTCVKTLIISDLFFPKLSEAEKKYTQELWTRINRNFSEYINEEDKPLADFKILYSYLLKYSPFLKERVSVSTFEEETNKFVLENIFQLLDIALDLQTCVGAYSSLNNVFSFLAQLQLKNKAWAGDLHQIFATMLSLQEKLDENQKLDLLKSCSHNEESSKKIVISICSV